MDRNGIIGDSKTNSLPWHLPEDLAHFKRMTMGHAIIMGRKTFASLGERPLKGRLNLVLTHLGGMYGGAEGSVYGKNDELYCGSLEYALDIAQTDKETNPSGEAFIIGGASVYREALDKRLVDRLIVTHIDLESDGDIKFPYVDWERWSQRTEIRLCDLASVVTYKKFDFSQLYMSPEAVQAMRNWGVDGLEEVSFHC